ncbi:hypothetical protein KC644_00015 [Candidatus Berkelbacteria bacterium]|nr:hypothetical protein [Candidatus Berkelbacteria bacterium]
MLDVLAMELEQDLQTTCQDTIELLKSREFSDTDLTYALANLAIADTNLIVCDFYWKRVRTNLERNHERYQASKRNGEELLALLAQVALIDLAWIRSQLHYLRFAEEYWQLYREWTPPGLQWIEMPNYCLVNPGLFTGFKIDRSLVFEQSIENMEDQLLALARLSILEPSWGLKMINRNPQLKHRVVQELSRLILCQDCPLVKLRCIVNALLITDRLTIKEGRWQLERKN